jgi:plasmid stabilization system protein ParE
MTAIRWTEPANADFLGIIEWLNARNPTAAARVGRRILDTVEILNDHPYLGKPGRSPDTRELGRGLGQTGGDGRGRQARDKAILECVRRHPTKHGPAVRVWTVPEVPRPLTSAQV